MRCEIGIRACSPSRHGRTDVSGAASIARRRAASAPLTVSAPRTVAPPSLSPRASHRGSSPCARAWRRSGKHTSITACVTQLLQTEGVSAFGAGLQARCVRLFLSQAIQFTIVDALTARFKARAAAPARQPTILPPTPTRHPSVIAPPERAGA